MQSYNEYYSNINKYKDEVIKLIDPQDGNELTKFLAAKEKVIDGINQVLNQVAIHDTNNSLIEGLKALSKQENTQNFFETFKNRLDIEIKIVSKYLNSERLKEKVTSKAPLNEIYQIIEEDCAKLSGEEKQTFNNKLCSLICTAFYDTINKDLQTGYQLFETFMENVPNKELLNMDTKVFTTYYEVPGIKGKYQYVEEINKLMESNLDDKDLLNISSELRELFKGPGNTTEDNAKLYDKIFKKKVVEVAKKNNVFSHTNPDDLAKFSRKEPEEIITILRENKNENINNVKFSEETKRKILELYNYAKENIINKGFTNMSYFLKGATDPLLEAIKKNEPEKVKELYKLSKERENVIVYLVTELRKLNPSTLFLSNNVDNRVSDKFPGYLFSDTIANSLVNEFLFFYSYERYDLTLNEILDDPIKSLQKMGEIAQHKNAICNLFNKNEFDIINDFYLENGDINDLVFDNLDDMEFDIECNNRYSEMAVFDPEEDKFELYNILDNYVNSIIRANKSNIQYIKNQVFSPSKSSPFLTTVMPSKLLLGDKFNIYEHSGLTNPAPVNCLTLDDYPKFDRIQYMKDNMKFDELLNKAKEINEKFKTHKFKNDRVCANIQVSIDVLKEEVMGIVNQKTNDQKFIQYYNKTINGQTLTPIQKNSFDAKVQFYNTLVDKDENFTKESFENTIQAIADLKKKYNTHNALAKFFFTNLKDQYTMINNMIDELAKTGISKNDITQAVDIFASKEPSNVDNFKTKINSMWDRIEIQKGLNSFNVKTTKEEIEVNKINSKEGVDMKIDFTKDDISLQENILGILQKDNKQNKENINGKGSTKIEVDKTIGGKES